VFPVQVLYTFFMSPMHATLPAHISILQFIVLINAGHKRKLWTSLIIQLSPTSYWFFPLQYKHSQHRFQTPSICVIPLMRKINFKNTENTTQLPTYVCPHVTLCHRRQRPYKKWSSVQVILQLIWIRL
jgi:hypothetical protein